MQRILHPVLHPSHKQWKMYLEKLSTMILIRILSIKSQFQYIPKLNHFTVTLTIMVHIKLSFQINPANVFI